MSRDKLISRGSNSEDIIHRRTCRPTFVYNTERIGDQEQLSHTD